MTSSSSKQHVRTWIACTGQGRRMIQLQRHQSLSLAGLTIALLSLGASSAAHAECLGIPLPEPQQLNICRELVEDLVVPPVVSLEPNCDLGLFCALTPHCCIPGACLAFPECVVTKEVVKAAGYVAHAGDVYCGLQDISPEQLVSDLVDDRIPDPTTIATGGVNSVLYTVAGAYVDTLECKASALGSFKNIAKTIMTLPGFPGSFADIDLDNVRILPKRESGVLNLPKDGYDAITLGSLVILQDELYDALVGTDWFWPAVVLEWTDVMDRSMFTMIHELVHVRQYRELGREQFMNVYLRDAVLNGYANADFEEEAYSVSGRQDSWCEGAVQQARQENNPRPPRPWEAGSQP
jgi:hypothetical protein